MLTRRGVRDITVTIVSFLVIAAGSSLLATALVYFVFAYLLASLLTLAERRIDPRQRPRVLKKVEVRK